MSGVLFCEPSISAKSQHCHTTTTNTNKIKTNYSLNALTRFVSSHLNIFALHVSKMRIIFAGDCKKRQISRHEQWVKCITGKSNKQKLCRCSAVCHTTSQCFNVLYSGWVFFVVVNNEVNIVKYESTLTTHNVISPFSMSDIHFFPNPTHLCPIFDHQHTVCGCQNLIWWIVSQSLIHWPISD